MPQSGWVLRVKKPDAVALSFVGYNLDSEKITGDLTTMFSRRSGFIAALCLLLTSIMSAADLSGTWVANVDAHGASTTFTFVFDVQGETFTGTATPEGGQPQPISDGKIDGNKISFKAGPPKDLAYIKGTIEGETLKLTLADANGVHQFSMTATRKKSGT
jgi:hypothetical protein